MQAADSHIPHHFGGQLQELRSFIHEALGWHYRASVGAPSILLPLRAVGMITTLSGAFEFRGRVDGRAFGGQSFELADVTAGKMSDTRSASSYYNEQDMDIAPYLVTDDTRRGFQGVIISLPHHSNFQGVTIIRRDMGRLNPKKIEGLKRVGFASSEFERIFEVYSDDQVEARYLITPDLMERLISFSDDYLGRNLQCAFIRDKFHITVDIDDRFDFSRDFDAADYQDAATLIINEIGAIFYLLEKMQTLQARIGAKGEAAVDAERAAYYSGLIDNLIPAIRQSADKFENTHSTLKEIRQSLPLFCESLHGLLVPRF